MSILVMSRVWADSPSSGGRLLVLLALADFANDDGWCWPSIETLARKARLSERQVQRIIRELVADGELVVDAQAGAAGQNCYGVTFCHPPMGEGDDIDPRGGMTPASPKPSVVEPSVKKRSSNDDPKDSPLRTLRAVLEHYNARRLEQNPRKRAITLESTVRTMIQNAVRVTSLDECLEAIDGLFKSSYHLGNNEQRREYLEIRHALKPNTTRGETIEEKIAKMRAYRGGAETSATNRKVSLLLDAVRYTNETGGERARAAKAREQLTGMGWKIIDLDTAPFARLQRA